MEILVERYELGETQTWGKMYIDGEFFADTLEDKDRYLEVEGCDAKVYANTAIPTGKYKVTPYYWNKYKDWYALLMNVPCFSGIFIHGGYNELDSAGCILIGDRHKNVLLNCKPKVQRLRDAILACRDLKKNITITVSRKDETTTI